MTRSQDTVAEAPVTPTPVDGVKLQLGITRFGGHPEGRGGQQLATGQHIARRHPQGFIVAPRGDTGLELLRTNRNAFALLYVIAMRARWRGGFNQHGLGPGQAFIGDWRSYGMTQREYRTAKALLQAHQFATFKATNKGTIATLISTEVFDVGAQLNDDQTDRQPASRRLASGEQATTNGEGKKETRKEAHTLQGNPSERPSIEEVTDYSQKIGLAEWKGRDWFNEMEAGGWLDYAHRPIANWKAALERVKAKWESDGSPSAPPPPRTTAGRRNGTVRAIKPSPGAGF